jgi:hypothetical protein
MSKVTAIERQALKLELGAMLDLRSSSTSRPRSVA